MNFDHLNANKNVKEVANLLQPSFLVINFGLWLNYWDHRYKQLKWASSVGWTSSARVKERSSVIQFELGVELCSSTSKGVSWGGSAIGLVCLLVDSFWEENPELVEWIMYPLWCERRHQKELECPLGVRQICASQCRDDYWKLPKRWPHGHRWNFWSSTPKSNVIPELGFYYTVFVNLVFPLYSSYYWDHGSHYLSHQVLSSPLLNSHLKLAFPEGMHTACCPACHSFQQISD